jgi:hypothetical protein
MSTLSVQTITDVSSFDFANTQFAGAYNASNAAFNSANLSYNAQNVVFAVANAAFDAANNVGPQIAPTYNTANLAFNKANSALPNTTNAVFQGNLTITGTLTIGQNTVTITETSLNVANGLFVTKDYMTMPTGNTAQRPSSAMPGMMRFNTQTGYLEQYSESGWASMPPPPVVSSVTPSTFNGELGTAFTINGSGFDSAPVVKFITSLGVEYSASITTRVSGTQITATTPQDFTVSDEPLKVKVINSSGLSFVLDSAIDCGGLPAWSNSSGSLGSSIAGVSSGILTTVAATDPDTNSTVSFSLTSGSLPSGTYLGSANGNIFGAPAFSDSNSTYSFTLTATDNAGNQTPRSFSLFVERGVETGGGLGWITSASVTTVANNITNNGMTLYQFNHLANSGAPSQWLNYSYGNFTLHTGHDGQKPTYCCFNLTSGTPRVLNRYRWVKHANACGNIDFYGSNQSITSDNFKTMSNWTYLGRGHMGGSGSEGDGTVKTAAFNSNKYGYRWYMILIRDNSSTAYSYPTEGTMAGYAMYGATFDYIG